MALVFATAFGTLQIVALRNCLDGLAWPLGPAHRRLGHVLAGALVIFGILGGLLLVTEEPLPPVLVAAALLAGVLLALGASLTGAATRLRFGRRKRSVRLVPGERIEQGPLRATFRPPQLGKRAAAVCVLPDPTSPSEDLAELTAAFAEAGLAVLALDWRPLRSVDRLNLQGAVSIALSWLAQREDTDPARIGLVGVGLGGDLALRSGSTDPDVAAVLAIEPVLGRGRPGPGLEGLRGLSWFRARRRTRRWRRTKLVRELDAARAIPAVVPRHVALLVSGRPGPEDEGPPQILRVADGWALRPCGRPEAVELARRWMLERLR